MKKWLTNANNASSPQIKPSGLKFAFTDPANDTKIADTTKEDLVSILFTEMQEFKQQGLYEEALSCIQRIFEIDENNITNAKYLYELAIIYFQLKDFARSVNWLEKFLDLKPQDSSGLLLKACLFLQTNDKEACLNIVNNLLNAPYDFKDETKMLFFQDLDKLLEKLTKIFKAEKLYRRAPAILAYQKKRRQYLHQHKQILSESEPLPMYEQSTPIEIAVNQIWDDHKANAKTTQVILQTPEELVNRTILKQVLSYKKKLWLYNYIATIFYQHHQLKPAIYLLRQALLLDDENDLILKNLGYLLYKQGEKAAAKATLSDIANPDFMLMDLVKQCD